MKMSYVELEDEFLDALVMITQLRDGMLAIARDATTLEQAQDIANEMLVRTSGIIIHTEED